VQQVGTVNPTTGGGCQSAGCFPVFGISKSRGNSRHSYFGGPTSFAFSASANSSHTTTTVEPGLLIAASLL
jgi:hypothetical protein